MTVVREPPNGGWGWMVVFGAAITNLVNQSLFSQFGLIFGDRLKEMGQGTIGASLLMNVNSMVTNFSGLVTGPLLKNYSHRSLTLTGVIFTAFGMMWTSRATSMIELIISYSFFTGLGLGLIMPSTFVVVNSYFTSKKSQAVGLSMAGTSVGQMLMPQVIRILLDEYGFQWTTLILGALCLNGLPGALLFHPVEWHEISLISDETPLIKVQPINTTNDTGKENSFWKKLMKILDLHLLKQFGFVHLTIGLALVYTCSVTFSMLLPFLLQDGMGFTRTSTAFCMTILSASDIVGRLTIPTISKYLSLNSTTTFLIAATFLAITRSILAQQTTFDFIIIMAILCGYLRAATVVNQNLTVSEYCTDQTKLPAALGLNMVAKGLIVLSVGQVFGWIRDYSQSFIVCIYAQSLVMVFVSLSWCMELIIRKVIS